METLYHIVCHALRSSERWQNNRRARFMQKNNTYNELQLGTKKG